MGRYIYRTVRRMHVTQCFTYKKVARLFTPREPRHDTESLTQNSTYRPLHSSIQQFNRLRTRMTLKLTKDTFATGTAKKKAHLQLLLLLLSEISRCDPPRIPRLRKYFAYVVLRSSIKPVTLTSRGHLPKQVLGPSQGLPS